MFASRQHIPVHFRGIMLSLFDYLSDKSLQWNNRPTYAQRPRGAQGATCVGTELTRSRRGHSCGGLLRLARADRGIWRMSSQQAIHSLFTKEFVRARK